MTDEAQTGVKRISIAAKVFRADGTVEDLGIIDEYNAPDEASPTEHPPMLAQLKNAWLDGWREGMKKEQPEPPPSDKE